MKVCLQEYTKQCCKVTKFNFAIALSATSTKTTMSSVASNYYCTNSANKHQILKTLWYYVVLRKIPLVSNGT